MAFMASIPWIIIVFKPPQPEHAEYSINIPVDDALSNFNARSRSIQTFSSDANFYVTEHGIRFKLTGSVQYEKPNHFRMRIRSVFGEELDMGSNDQVFWYWSRKDPRPGLYFAYHEDYLKTRLKTPFDPVFLRESLGLDEIKPQQVLQDGKDILVVCPPKMNSSGKIVTRWISLNGTTNYVEHIVVLDSDSKKLAACSLEYTGLTLKRICYDWFEESRSMVVEFKSPKYNLNLDGQFWQLPNYQPRINMAED
jgi:hypothetical protein